MYLSAFHIDADEVVETGGVRDEVADDALGERGALGRVGVVADVHSHLGELEADVGVEFLESDFVDEAMVDGGGSSACAASVTDSPRESRVDDDAFAIL